MVKPLTFKSEVFSFSKTKRHIATKISISACLYNAVGLTQLHDRKDEAKIRNLFSTNHPSFPTSREK